VQVLHEPEKRELESSEQVTPFPPALDQQLSLTVKGNEGSQKDRKSTESKLPVSSD
jgi:hypothetical protein